MYTLLLFAGNFTLFQYSFIGVTGKLRRRQFYSQPLETGKVLDQGSTFTYQDILDELLVYTPDTHGSVTDEIHFSVTDGVHTETGRLEFSMDVKKSDGPRVTINRGLQIAAGQYKVMLHYLMRYRVAGHWNQIFQNVKKIIIWSLCSIFFASCILFVVRINYFNNVANILFQLATEWECMMMREF